MGRARFIKEMNEMLLMWWWMWFSLLLFFSFLFFLPVSLLSAQTKLNTHVLFFVLPFLSTPSIHIPVSTCSLFFSFSLCLLMHALQRN